MEEIYISIDVEADGPLPGLHSMLSFGAAAFRLDSPKPFDTFGANLEQLSDAAPSAHTMKWWATQPEAWAAHRVDPEPAAVVMPRFIQWVRALPGRPVIVGYPVTFDFMWVYWYTMAFGGLKDGEPSPFGFQGLDLKTLAWAKLGGEYRATTPAGMPQEWFKDSPKHDHVALTDAIGQGAMFVNMAQSKKVKL